MANTSVKFGFGQVFKKTPEIAKLAFRFVLYGAAIIVFVMQTFTDIPQHIKDVVSRYALQIVTLIHFLTKMFGLDVKDPDTTS